MLSHHNSLIKKTSQLTADYIKQAEQAFSISLPVPEICFDLKGSTAGQAIIQGDATRLRYHLGLLVEFSDCYMQRTVPHEVAHLVVFHLYGGRVRPHGKEWKKVMRIFGADDSRCHDFNSEKIKVRRLKQFEYRCGCRQHQLSSIRHNRVRAGSVYRCSRCRSPLRACL